MSKKNKFKVTQTATIEEAVQIIEEYKKRDRKNPHKKGDEVVECSSAGVKKDISLSANYWLYYLDQEKKDDAHKAAQAFYYVVGLNDSRFNKKKALDYIAKQCPGAVFVFNQWARLLVNSFLSVNFPVTLKDLVWTREYFSNPVHNRWIEGAIFYQMVSTYPYDVIVNNLENIEWTISQQTMSDIVGTVLSEITEHTSLQLCEKGLALSKHFKQKWNVVRFNHLRFLIRLEGQQYQVDQSFCREIDDLEETYKRNLLEGFIASRLKRGNLTLARDVANFFFPGSELANWVNDIHDKHNQFIDHPMCAEEQ